MRIGENALSNSAAFLSFSFFFFGRPARPASPAKQGGRTNSRLLVERYKIIPCSSSLFLHFINAHT